MIVWLDAQLPVALARWLRGNGVTVQAIRDMRPRPVQDRAIVDAARQSGHVVISKDQDFETLVKLHGPPPQIVRLTCGNLTKGPLIAYFEANWTGVEAELKSGAHLVIM
jgi:predicted nuclease of predicted toxin-antitoxin system